MSKGYLLGPNAARKLSRLLGNTKGVGETVSGGAVVDTQEWPDPFTIRWSAANAAWLMLKGIVQYNGAELEIDGETPEGYQSPWIILGDIPAEASGMVYLNIDTESESGATASVALEASGTLSVPLAEISRGNDSLAVEVKQHVRSALVIASAGSGEGGSGADGVGIKSITEGTAYESDDGEYTVTPITVTLTNDQTQQFEVRAKNGGGAALEGTVDFIGDVKYDMTDHQIKKRVDQLDLATGLVTQGEWVMVENGQAVAHSSTIA